ncbi:MAG: phosphate ABC transporter permease subunit PstC [Chlorobi bacterium CHB2]|nr:phosphate ABC transporter permease subunit PstC [Chlorobi bacterium CHB2]
MKPEQPTQQRQPKQTPAGAATGGAGSYPSLTQKERRIGERLIELGIFAVSTTSIIFIFLIFLFVFREASPIFFGGAESEKKETPAVVQTPGGTATAMADTGEIESEQYNPEEKDLPSLSPAGDSTGMATTAPGGTPPKPTTPEEEAERARRIVGDDYPILEHESPVNVSYLAYDNWQPNSEHPRYGIYPIILGTLKTTLVAMVFAVPLAILAALYTAFFAPQWIREKLKPVIELLAGIPSVVLGFFCLMTVASVVQSVFGLDFRLNSIVGGIGLGLAVIPIVYTICDDALRAVPQSLREASLAVGASEWQTAYRVMLPAATPGVFAAILLGTGRAVGETMIALMATGNAGTFNWSFTEPVRTFAATIGAEMGEVVFGSPHYQVLFFLGVLLFIFSFIINFITEFYVKERLIKKFRGA